MRIIYNITGLLLATSVLISCTRKNEDLNPAPAAVGGTGGHTSLVITPQHHEKNLFDSRVFIKYNATSAPSTDTFGYDAAEFTTLSNGRPVVTFKDLKQGNYYVYAIGSDEEVGPDKYNMRGGAHFRIVNNDKDTTKKSQDIYVQLGEATHHLK